MILADEFVEGWLVSGGTRCAWGDSEIAALIASLQIPIQPQFHTQWLMAHAGLHIFTGDLISLAGKRKGVVVANHALLDVAQDRGQLQLVQATMLIREARDRLRETCIPLRPILGF